jgi:hypothetical protein
LRESGDLASADAHLQAARQVFEALSDSGASDVAPMRNLADVYLRLADIARPGAVDTAAMSYAAAARVLTELDQRDDQSLVGRESTSRMHQHLAEVMWEAGNHEDAEAHLQAAQRLLALGSPEES